MYSTRKRPRVSSATGTWKPRKKARLTSRTTPSVGLRGELKYIDTVFQDTIPDSGDKQTTQVKRIAKREARSDIAIQMCETVYASGTVSTTLVTTSLINELMTSKLPQMNPIGVSSLPLYNLPGEDYRRLRVQLTGIMINCLVRGTEGSTLLQADSYNNIRMRLIWTDEPFQTPSSFAMDSPPTVVSPMDNREVERVYFDKLFYLPTITFNSAGFAVPTQRTFRRFVKLNRIIDCFSTVDTGTIGAWETKKGNLYFQAFSDSSAPLHPTITMSTQLYYKYLM